MEKTRRRITDTERIQFEALYNGGMKIREIAKVMDRSDKTLYQELKRGLYEHTNTNLTTTMKYSSDKSKLRYQQKCENCGRPLKIGNDHALVKYLTKKIKVERFSPAAALASIDREGKEFKTRICVRTVYNYIYSGMVFLDLTREDLPEKPQEVKRRKEKVMKRISSGTSIEKRPEEIKTRDSFGHWEMDTVVSGENGTAAILAFTERKTRNELVYKINSQEAAEPVKVLNKIERALGSKTFRMIFKSITVDNGTENQDYVGLERSYRNKKARTKIYYCHPYSPEERGSNENNNKLIRRFVPKGADISGYSPGEIQEIGRWMNRYPRKLLDWDTAGELFCQELIRAVGFVPEFFQI